MKVAQWNFERNNTEFDYELEKSMLEEEAREFKDGLNDYFKALENNEDPTYAIVDMIDAACDYMFVASGTEYKSLGHTKQEKLVSLIDNTIDYMFHIVANIDGLPSNVLNDSFELVVKANGAKGKEKINGKIQKGEDWIDPKESIFNLLTKKNK